MVKHQLEPNERELLHVDRMGNFLRVIAATHRLTGFRGQANAMVIGPPGYGKTQMLLRLEGNSGTLVLSDTTFLGILKMVEKAKQGYLTTVIIPDLGPALARDLPQVRKVVSACSMAIEEGVHKMVVGKLEKDYGGARFGMLSALTVDDIQTHFSILQGSGFLSRFILLELSLSEEALLLAVQQNRDGNERLTAPLMMPESRGVAVKIPEKYAREGEAMWRSLLKERDDRASGFRGLHLYQSLIAATCYLREPRTLVVTSEDVEMMWGYHQEFMLTQTKMAV